MAPSTSAAIPVSTPATPPAYEATARKGYRVERWVGGGRSSRWRASVSRSMPSSLRVHPEWQIPRTEVARRWRSNPAWRRATGPVRIAVAPIPVAISVPVAVAFPISLAIPISFATSLVSVRRFSSLPEVQIAVSSPLSTGIAGPSPSTAAPPSPATPHEIAGEPATSGPARHIHQCLWTPRWFPREGITIRVAPGRNERGLVEARFDRRSTPVSVAILRGPVVSVR